jgi:hypothetical protein
MVHIRCITRVDQQLALDLNNAESLELQRKMYTMHPYVLNQALLHYAPHCLCMYAVIGVVFVAFLVRFGFQVFLAYLHMSVSPLNPSCPFVSDADRCGESFFL